MKYLSSLAPAILLSLSVAAAGCTLEGNFTVDDQAEDVEQEGFFARLPGFLAIGASITFGIGASDPATKGSTALFADYLEETHFQSAIDFLNLAVPGATSQDILDEQTKDGVIFNVQHLFRKKVIWVASGGNDLLALINTPGALDPCMLPPEVPDLGVSFACYDVLREVMTEYEDNLRTTLKRMRFLASEKNAVLMVRTELNGLDEDNCLADGAIDANGDVFITPEFVAALRPLGDLAIEGEVPAIAQLGFPGFEGLNPIMRRLGAEYGAVVIDTFTTFKVAALSGGDLVTRDCIHPNDDGHDAIYQLAVSAFEEADD